MARDWSWQGSESLAVFDVRRGVPRRRARGDHGRLALLSAAGLGFGDELWERRFWTRNGNRLPEYASPAPWR